MIPLAFVIIFILVAIILYKPFNYTGSSESIDIGKGWVIDGSDDTINIESIEDSKVLVYKYTTIKDNHKYKLCFKTLHTYVTVYADDVNIYEYKPDVNKLLGKSYGVYAHSVAIPEHTQKISLELKSVYNDEPARVRDMAYETEADFLINMLRKSAIDLFMSAIMLVFGVTMIIIDLTSKEHSVDSDVQINFTSVGVFSILASFWAVNDTYILQILLQKPDLIKAVSYISLMLMPVMCVSFIHTMTLSTEKLSPNIVGILVAVDFTVTMVLTIGSVSDFPKLVWITQIVTVITLFLMARLIFISIKHGVIERKRLSKVLFGVNMMAVGAITDLIRSKSHGHHNFSSGAFTKVGIVIFIIMLGIQLIKEKNKRQDKYNQDKIRAQLAYIDGLTGLQNRLSFNNTEEDLDGGVKDCIVIQLDINDLKKVNDNYGHSEGDKHITSAANIIKKSFKLGTCFRTGGDEFIVIMYNGTQEELDTAVEEMKIMTETYNENEKPPVEMAIAYGYAFYNHETDSLRQVEIEADNSMYKCKREMKGERRKNKE